jgi:hypothetical protein
MGEGPFGQLWEWLGEARQALRAPLRPLLSAIPSPALLVMLVLAATALASGLHGFWGFTYRGVLGSAEDRRQPAPEAPPPSSDWLFIFAYLTASLWVAGHALLVLWLFADGLGGRGVGKALMGLVLSVFGVGISISVSAVLQRHDDRAFAQSELKPQASRVRILFLHGLMGAMLAMMLLIVFGVAARAA